LNDRLAVGAGAHTLRAVRLLAMLALVSLLGACDDAPQASTVHARIERFTGCPVPPSAVQLHDHIGGDAAEAVTHARLAIPKDELPDFLAGCGTTLEALQPGYDPSELRPERELEFWTLPQPQLIRGGEVTRDGIRSVVMLHERDTDIAIYLYARRAGD
jgi:hypothetical protein